MDTNSMNDRLFKFYIILLLDNPLKLLSSLEQFWEVDNGHSYLSVHLDLLLPDLHLHHHVPEDHLYRSVLVGHVVPVCQHCHPVQVDLVLPVVPVGLVVLVVLVVPVPEIPRISENNLGK